MRLFEILLTVVFFVFAPLYDHYSKKWKWIRNVAYALGLVSLGILIGSYIYSPPQADFSSNSPIIRRDSLSPLLPDTVNQKLRKPLISKPKASSTSDTSKIVIGSGSVVSINQQGGITAGVVKIDTVANAPEVNFTAISEMVPKDSLFVSTYKFSLRIHSPINSFSITAKSPIVSAVKIMPTIPGAFSFGTSKGIDSITYTVYQPYSGDYNLLITTMAKGRFEIHPSYTSNF
jgi:hypothetical protein